MKEINHKPIVRFDGEYNWLSNFYVAPITVGNGPYTFQTNEHAFQASKWHAMDQSDTNAIKDYIQSIISNDDPKRAKYAGRSVKIDLAKWESIKVWCMRDLVFTKFKQHPELQTKLIDTGAAMLVEGNIWGDKFWGRVDGKGLNVLGSLLMEVRGFYAHSGAPWFNPEGDLG